VKPKYTTSANTRPAIASRSSARLPRIRAVIGRKIAVATT
jgi:hypothetical protein